MPPEVVTVHLSPAHTFSKPRANSITLLEGLGVEGDAHSGATVKHRSRVAADPSQPNLRQVHLIHAELFDDLRDAGYDVHPGDLGENLTSRGLDLLGLPVGARLTIGDAVIAVTGLRNPCRQINDFRSGLLKKVLRTDADGTVERLAGIMGTVSRGGRISPGDGITIELPPAPHHLLTRVRQRPSPPAWLDRRMATMTLGPADLVRRQGLRRMRAVAASLLVLAAVIYLATLHRDGGWGYLNAAAEAAMVGALADWFAVTALFRRPLGLPIPHTAIVPTRKDALAESLEQFVTENFLAEHVVAEKMRTAEVSRRAGEWLVAGNHAERIVAEGARTIGVALPKLSDEDVQTFVQGSLLPRFANEPLSPIAGHFLQSVVDDGAHHALFDLLVVEAYDWLRDNRDTVAEVVGPRAPRWSPHWVDSLVIDRIHREALAWLADVRDNPAHPARKAIDRLLGTLADDLQHDPATRERFEAVKRRMLDHPDLAPSLTAVWDALRTALIDAIAEPDSPLRTRAAGAVRDLGHRLQSDAGLRSRVDLRAAEAVGYVVRTYGREIVSVISDTIERWDGREAAARIELHVGRDLQFIRINGTVVGALVGLAIHAFSQFV